MPAKKTKTTKKSVAKKETVKSDVKVVKKIVKKTTAKTVSLKTKAADPIVKKVAKKETNFGLMNVIAIVVTFVLISLAAWGISLVTQKKTINNTNSIAAQTLSYDCAEGQTALAVLKEKNTVQTQDSTFGVFVDEINGTKNDSGSFWIFYINEQPASVGPDQYTCQNGDKIQWRFEKII